MLDGQSKYDSYKDSGIDWIGNTDLRECRSPSKAVFP